MRRTIIIALFLALCALGFLLASSLVYAQEPTTMPVIASEYSGVTCGAVCDSNLDCPFGVNPACVSGYCWDAQECRQ